MSYIKNFTYNAYVAILCGVNAATLFRDIAYHQERNQKNECNFYEGRYWVYNSKKAWAEIYPHLTERQVRTALDSLEQEGLIVSTDKLNENPFDKTKWYSITEKALEYTERLDLNIPVNRSDEKVRSHRTEMSNHARAFNIRPQIPHIRNARERLNKPLNIQEVIEEAGKRHCVIDELQAQDFIDKYEAVSENGTWVCGKSVVTDWRKLITSGWLRGWQKEYRETSKQNTGTPDDNRQTLEELAAEIARERAARGQA